MNGSLGRPGIPRMTNQNEYDKWRRGRRKRNVGKLAILRTTNRRLSHGQKCLREVGEKERICMIYEERCETGKWATAALHGGDTRNYRRDKTAPSTADRRNYNTTFWRRARHYNPPEDLIFRKHYCVNLQSCNSFWYLGKETLFLLTVNNSTVFSLPCHLIFV